MSILPQWHKGRVCIPWWYGLGYPVAWGAVGIGIGIKLGDSMLSISTYSVIALVVSAFIGVLAYTVLAAFSNYQEQKAQAAELKSKIALSGRDPNDNANLTPAEKWEIQKVAKFDKIFIIADILQVIFGTILAVCIVYMYGSRLLIDTWEQYAVFSLVVGLICAWFIGETVIKLAASGKWSKVATAAFQDVREIVEDVAKNAGMTRKDELIKLFVEQGFSRKEAADLAKEAILKELNN